MKYQATVWELDNLERIGDGELTVTGSPKVVECPPGRAVEFDGTGDSVVLDCNPLIGLEAYTVEVMFRPDAGGLPEQRFLHMGEVDGDRLLFETRLTGDGNWFLDTFIHSGDAGRTLFNEDFLHPVGEWCHLAVTCDGREQVNFVNGQLEQRGSIDYRPMSTGRTSIGVRLNQVCWFKGGIHKVRIAAGVLGADEFFCG